MLSLLLLPLLLLTGCSKDNDDELENVDAATFELTLVNNTANTVTIFLKDSQPNAGFAQRGTIAPGAEMVLPDLYVRQAYVIRASQQGNSAEDFFYEQTVIRESPTALVLTIE